MPVIGFLNGTSADGFARLMPMPVVTVERLPEVRKMC
jgi:hypothetical protein